jgi:hypothetical protein
MNHWRRLPALLAIAGSAALALAAQVDPLALPTRDAHQNLLVVGDPYLSAERYKAPFGKKSPYDGGILAIDVYFRNDNDSPIRLALETIRLMVSSPGEDRQRLAPLSPEDVADRLVLTARSSPSVPRLPIPFPTSGGKSSKGKAWDEMVTTLRSVGLVSEVLPPRKTIHGFLYFDMNHQYDETRYSHLYIPDLMFMTDKRPLLFFEIDFGSVATN